MTRRTECDGSCVVRCDLAESVNRNAPPGNHRKEEDDAKADRPGIVVIVLMTRSVFHDTPPILWDFMALIACLASQTTKSIGNRTVFLKATPTACLEISMGRSSQSRPARPA